jgi:dinuclear metal center YbgI/SA1388 family protein
MKNTVGDLVHFFEQKFPFSLQESYDNSGLLIGDKSENITGVLVSLDCTEKVVLEAIEKGCNVVVSHHPLIFKGIKRLNFGNEVERTIRLAIKNDIAILAIHTNLDNHFEGVNRRIGEKIGVVNSEILSPKEHQLYKLVVNVPIGHLETLDRAIFNAGAGSIGNYAECRFSSIGEGTFLPNEKSQPFEGNIGQRSFVKEERVEYLLPAFRIPAVLEAMHQTHPYEEVAHDLYLLENKHQGIGSGMIGELAKSVNLNDFLSHLKSTFNCGVIKHTISDSKAVRKIAWCGGAGSFLIHEAMRKKADIFLTGDLKYHDFFIPEQKMVLADIGHFESEQFTSELLVEELNRNFANFAVRLTEQNTNPINYF